MLFGLAAWVGGGALWAGGCWLLLHIRLARFTHEERMAKFDAAQRRAEDAIERSRAGRASRTRPDLAVLARQNEEPGPDVGIYGIDGPTEVMPAAAPDGPDVGLVDELMDEPEMWPSALDNEDARHQLPTPN